MNTVAVKADLVSYDFKNIGCESVGRFSQMLYENIDWLKENGHPKWKSVDPDFKLKGWEQYDCARKYLVKKAATLPSAPIASAANPAGKINPVMNAVKEMLNR